MDYTPIEDRGAQVLYNEGKSDKQIATEIQAHYKSVAKWRRRKGLPSNVPQGRPKKEKTI